MRKTIQTIALAALCLNFTSKAIAQEPIKPLKIGDTIPESLWNLALPVTNHPESKQTITLNDYKGKLIILDFWATWCTSCIANMPALHDLQKSIGPDLTVIPVTKQPEPLVQSFLQENKILKPLNLLTVVRDSILCQFFPHRLIPHYVWINHAGVVVAYTDGSEINRQSVTMAIRGNKPSMQQKYDQQKDSFLFASDALPEKQVTFYSMLVKGKYPGYGGGVNYRQKGDSTYGILLTNSSLRYVYEMAAKNFLPDNFSKRTVIEVAQPEKLLYRKADDPAWDKQNLYTYELRVPVERSAQLYPVMLAQLNQISGYRGSIESRPVNCLVLTLKKGSRLVLTRGDKYTNTLLNKQNLVLVNASMLALTGRLNNALPQLVIDETGEAGRIDLNIRLKAGDLPSIKQELSQHGFMLTESIRQTPVLVIADTTP